MVGYMKLLGSASLSSAGCLRDATMAPLVPSLYSSKRSYKALYFARLLGRIFSYSQGSSDNLYKQRLGPVQSGGVLGLVATVPHKASVTSFSVGACHVSSES